MRCKSGLLLQVVFSAAIVGIVLFQGCSSSQEHHRADSRAAEAEQATSFVYKGEMPKEFHEAPMLAELVKAGKLPAVKDRLPAKPLVIPPIEQIGKYGGTWRRAFTGPADFQTIDRIQHDFLLYYDLDGKTILPHILKSWDISDGGKVFTFHLRPGMKWSDGEPFTADDFVFAYEDIDRNDKINFRLPFYFRTRDANEPDGFSEARLEKVDDYTIRYIFKSPYYVFVEMAASQNISGQTHRGWNGPIYAPKHYLKQFHPRYAPVEKLEEQARGEGLKDWVMLFQHKARMQENPDLPVVGPWRTVTPMTTQAFTLERNPYYFAVDPNGNQLPYIDRISMQLTQSLEVVNLRAMQGQIDMQLRHIQLVKYPQLVKKAAEGQYHIYRWPSIGGSDAAVYINQSWEGDDEVAKWLRCRDFRIALSLATNRKEINELVFMGLGTPRPFMAPRDNPYYPGREYEQLNAQFDPDKANRMLDDLGLTSRDKEGYRLRTDGQGKLILSLSIMGDAMMDFAPVGELLERQWARIGVKLDLSMEERTRWILRRDNNEQQMCIFDGGCENPWTYGGFMIPVARGCPWAPAVGLWYDTDGQKGMPPTDEMRRLQELSEKGAGLPLEQRIEVGREMWRIHAQNAFVIGAVAESPAFNGLAIVKDNFHNVPRMAPNSSALQTEGIARPEQFYFDPLP